MLRLRLAILAACTLGLIVSVAPASAVARPNCGSQILTLSVKGSLTAWYSPGCYRQATRLITPDLRDYSDAPAVISTAARRDRLRKLHLVVAKRAPGSALKISFSPPVGSIRVSVFARKHGRFVAAAIATMHGSGGALKAKLGKATRIRVSAGYVGSGDKPVTVSLTLRR